MALQDVFLDTPGTVKRVEYHIPTPVGEVVKVPLQPTPLALKETLESEVQSMLPLGVIEEPTSPWRSPPVLVPKHDESLRFCVDFRRPNKITLFDAYPMLTPC